MSARRGSRRRGDREAREDALAEYQRRRDFSRTAEPRGSAADQGREPRFVVQIHDARRMHFDFRLEAEGVLKSWAIPKGPSTNPHDKRLAMATEDHPIEYRDFEGVIAPGEYGAGTVIIWDEGTYRLREKSGASVSEALRRGHLSFWLNGSKLHGGYALTRFRDANDDGPGEAWLLVKRNDERASPAGTPDPTRARSARTGRTLRQVASAAEEDG